MTTQLQQLNNPRSSVGMGREDPADMWSRLRQLAFGDAPSLGQQQQALDALPDGPEKDAARLEMANNMVGGFAGAIKAYHGSPHVFDRFDMSKIGTGEGAQAYGHGLYFAESPAIATHYKDALSSGRDLLLDGQPVDPKDPLHYYALQEASKPGHAAESADIIRGQIEHLNKKKAGQAALDPGWGALNKWDDMDAAYMADLEKRLGAFEQVSKRKAEFGPEKEGSLYEVNLHPDHEDLLDWDAPLSQQSEKVRAGLDQLGVGKAGVWREDNRTADRVSHLVVGARSAGEYYPRASDGKFQARTGRGKSEVFDTEAEARQFVEDGIPGDMMPTGEKVYTGLGNPVKAAAALREAGIPGLRYLDAGSRGAGDGSRNIVMFDDSKIDVLSRNGKPLAAGGGAGLLAAGGTAQAADAPEPRPAWSEGLTEEQYRRALAMMQQMAPAPEAQGNQHTVLDVPYPRFGNGGLF